MASPALGFPSFVLPPASSLLPCCMHASRMGCSGSRWNEADRALPLGLARDVCDIFELGYVGTFVCEGIHSLGPKWSGKIRSNLPFTCMMGRMLRAVIHNTQILNGLQYSTEWGHYARCVNFISFRLSLSLSLFLSLPPHPPPPLLSAAPASTIEQVRRGEMR